MELAIQTWALTKYYGPVRGCQAINLAVPAGRIFGFLGPNGAGKSTLVKLLVGLLTPTAGGATIFGRPLGDPQCRRLLGFLPEQYRMPDWPRAEELLAYYGRLCGLEGDALQTRTAAVLAQVGLAEAAGRRVGGFSNGMKQRLALGAALLHRPRLLILDEPTAALDPLGRRFVRSLLLDLAREGTAIFINSHLLSEIERVCDEVAIIRGGTVVAAGPLQELAGSRIEITLRAQPLDESLLAALRALGHVDVQGHDRALVTVASPDAVPAVAATVHAAGARLHELTPHARSLEELFVELVAPPEEVSRLG